jgi:hypothetical protein
MHTGCIDTTWGWLGNLRKLKRNSREEGFHNLKITHVKLKLYEKPKKHRKHNKASNKQGTLNKLTQTRRIPIMVTNYVDGIFPP